MKQTAVEQLEEYLTISLGPDRMRMLANEFEKAKAMEKEQHDKTAEEWWKEGAHYMENVGRAKWESFEQYYNETFKSE